MTCNSCGAVIQDTDDYCSVCGEKVERPETKAVDLNKDYPFEGSPAIDDKIRGVDVLLYIVSFFVPWIGMLFLAFVWKNIRMSKRYHVLCIILFLQAVLNVLVGICTSFVVISSIFELIL